MAMDRNLRAFLAIARTGSLSAAAEQLRLAQPSLTKRLKLLEDEYRVALFDRQPRGMKLTVAGEKLLTYARMIENTHLQAREMVEATRSLHLDVLKVGAGPLFGRGILAEVFHDLRQEFPETRLVLQADVHLQNLPRLRAGHLDVVLGALVTNFDDETIIAMPVAQVHLGALVSRDSAIARKEVVTAADIAKMQWILYSEDPETIAMIRGYFIRNGLVPPVFAIQTSSYELGLNLLSRGDYVMPVPMELAATFEPLGLATLPLRESLDRFPAGAYLRKSSLAYPVIDRLIRLISERVQKISV